MIPSIATAWAMGCPPVEHLFGNWWLGIEMFSQVYHGFGGQWIGRTFLGTYRGDEEVYE